MSAESEAPKRVVTLFFYFALTLFLTLTKSLILGRAKAMSSRCK